jgi:hypothetical protein
MIVQNVAPFAGMTQTGSTGVISAATGAAPLAVSTKDGDFCAFLQASRNAGLVESRCKGPFQVDFRRTNLMLRASPREADSTARAH